MIIQGLDGADSSILTNPCLSTIRYAKDVAAKSPEHRAAILAYFTNKRDRFRPETIGRELCEEYLEAIEQ